VVFVLDLMKLDVPYLFYDRQRKTSVPGKNFKEYLHHYIASSGLSKELLKRMDTIMDCIHDTPHGFQDIILTVLQKVCEQQTSDLT